jgi:hypothetical protein
MRRDAPGRTPQARGTPGHKAPARPLQTANPYIAFCGRMQGAGRGRQTPPGTEKLQASPERPGAEIGGMFDNGCYVIRPSARGLHNTPVIRLAAAAGRKRDPASAAALPPARSLFLLRSQARSGAPGRGQGWAHKTALGRRLRRHRLTTTQGTLDGPGRRRPWLRTCFLGRGQGRRRPEGGPAFRSQRRENAKRFDFLQDLADKVGGRRVFAG